EAEQHKPRNDERHRLLGRLVQRRTLCPLRRHADESSHAHDDRVRKCQTPTVQLFPLAATLEGCRWSRRPQFSIGVHSLPLELAAAMLRRCGEASYEVTCSTRIGVCGPSLPDAPVSKLCSKLLTTCDSEFREHVPEMRLDRADGQEEVIRDPPARISERRMQCDLALTPRK